MLLYSQSRIEKMQIHKTTLQQEKETNKITPMINKSLSASGIKFPSVRRRDQCIQKPI